MMLNFQQVTKTCTLEHDAKNYEAAFGRHHALLFDLDADSDFSSNKPEIIRL
ncbi:hypothetical protein [Mesorhizobium sp. CA4]|uniref:hypothetical protein n=1 Tax=Mesorhizobium sp. CA4 TaxID=588499 RepID=UPI001CD1767A|nr:hypothetical protein [Mesorhizobium sp. CA4]MBZ9819049.1 hypothetical protein [Mesorhizobium sp. CA4]